MRARRPQIKERRNPDGARNINFVDQTLRFSGAGRVSAWDFWAGDVGSMAVQVWRPANVDNGHAEAVHQYTLICENYVHAETANIDYHFEIPAEEHCTVRDGDVIGWYHQSSGIIDFDYGRDDGSADTVRWHYGDHPGIGGVVDFDGCALCAGRAQVSLEQFSAV